MESVEAVRNARGCGGAEIVELAARLFSRVSLMGRLSPSSTRPRRSGDGLLGHINDGTDPGALLVVVLDALVDRSLQPPSLGPGERAQRRRRIWVTSSRETINDEQIFGCAISAWDLAVYLQLPESRVVEALDVLQAHYVVKARMDGRTKRGRDAGGDDGGDDDSWHYVIDYAKVMTHVRVALQRLTKALLCGLDGLPASSMAGGDHSKGNTGVRCRRCAAEFDLTQLEHGYRCPACKDWVLPRIVHEYVIRHSTAASSSGDAPERRTPSGGRFTGTICQTPWWWSESTGSDPAAARINHEPQGFVAQLHVLCVAATTTLYAMTAHTVATGRIELVTSPRWFIAQWEYDDILRRQQQTLQHWTYAEPRQLHIAIRGRRAEMAKRRSMMQFRMMKDAATLPAWVTAPPSSQLAPPPARPADTVDPGLIANARRFTHFVVRMEAMRMRRHERRKSAATAAESQPKMDCLGWQVIGMQDAFHANDDAEHPFVRVV